MFDLGRTFLAAVERSPDATAIADGERRLGYASWYEEIACLASGLTELGLRRGDRLAVILQNRLEMASLHWACQFAGIVVTPLNWRIKPEELDYCLADADATAIVFDDVAAHTVAGAGAAQRLLRIAIGKIDGATCRFEGLCQLSRLLIDDVLAILPGAQAVSRMPSAIAALRMCCQRRVAAGTGWRMRDRQRRKFRSSSWPRQYRLADPVLFNPSIGRHRPLMPR